MNTISRKFGVCCLLLLLTAVTQTAQPQPEGGTSRALQVPEDGHRVLRANKNAPPQPAEPQVFQGYPDAPEFTVVDRVSELNFFPCIGCHSVLPLNTELRKLMAPHPAGLEHGNGQYWCLDCHSVENRNALRTLNGTEVSFDEAHLVCGQCHHDVQKDFYYGGHGKRVSGWQEPREVYGCTHCHDPHDPAVKPRAPEAPPPVRRGLGRSLREAER